MLFKKIGAKKNNSKNDVDLDEINLPEEENSADSDKHYIVDQCEQMIELAKNVMDSKDEFRVVSAYLQDVEVIEKINKEEKNPVVETAREIARLIKARDDVMKNKHNISADRYALFKQNEEEIPKAIKRLKSNEEYQNAARKDMNYLEGEKIQWVDLKEDSLREQKTLRHVTFFLIGMFAIIIGVLFAASYTMQMDIQLYMIVATALAVISVSYILIRYQDTTTNIKRADVNRKQAVMLENRAKLKYVNATNAVEYAKTKFDVKNSYEFTYLWEQYNAVLQEKKKLHETNEDLVYFTDKLEDLLIDLDLNDVRFWNNYTEALVDKKELIEVKHNLVNRRNKLKQNIEFNKNEINSIKREIDSKVDEMGQDSDFIENIMEKINVMIKDENIEEAIKAEKRRRASKRRQEESEGKDTLKIRRDRYTAAASPVKEKDLSGEEDAEENSNGATSKEEVEEPGTTKEKVVNILKNGIINRKPPEIDEDFEEQDKKTAYTKLENKEFEDLAQEIDSVNEQDKEQHGTKTASQGIQDAVNRATQEIKEDKAKRQKEREKVKRDKMLEEKKRIEKEKREREIALAEEAKKEKIRKQREIERRLKEQEEARKVEEIQKTAALLRAHSSREYAGIEIDPFKNQSQMDVVMNTPTKNVAVELSEMINEGNRISNNTNGNVNDMNNINSINSNIKSSNSALDNDSVKEMEFIYRNSDMQENERKNQEMRMQMPEHDKNSTVGQNIDTSTDMKAEIERLKRERIERMRIASEQREQLKDAVLNRANRQQQVSFDISLDPSGAMQKNEADSRINIGDNAKDRQPPIEKKEPRPMTQADILEARVRANKEITMQKKKREEALNRLNSEDPLVSEAAASELYGQISGKSDYVINQGNVGLLERTSVNKDIEVRPHRKAAIEELVIDVPWNPMQSGIEQARKRKPTAESKRQEEARRRQEELEVAKLPAIERAKVLKERAKKNNT